MDSQKNVEASEGDWVKYESKIHPGRFYLFNKKTLETKWCGETPQDIPQASTLPATVSNSSLRTPEQDRLKRLEEKLKDEMLKRKAKKRSAENEPLILKSTKLFNDDNVIPDQNPAYPCTSTALNRGSGIVSRIKEFYEKAKKALIPRKLNICKISSDATDELDLAINPSPSKRIKYESAINSSEQHKCEVTNDENQQIVAQLTLETKHNSAHLVQNTLMQIEMEKDEQVISNNNSLPVQQAVANNNSVEMAGDSWSEIALDNEAIKQNEEFITSNLSVSSYELDGANARLLNLRKSLPEIAQADSKLLNTSTEAKSTSSNLTFMFHENIANGQQAQDDALLQDYAIDSTTTDESMINEAIESDIEPILPDEQNTELVKKSYDTVNENLLYFAEDRKQDQTVCTWLQDHYYFVLDTNVLLRHITFIEDLRGMKLCDTNGTVLYIPYCVLQELDKLKQYSAREGTKELAKRATKYLLSKFKSNDKHIQVQSAVSDMEHIIEITSADDKILNCCLQVQKAIGNVVLLTEDINLRNKAICNNISVSTKSDLVSKKF